jgi:hypothetical protein
MGHFAATSNALEVSKLFFSPGQNIKITTNLLNKWMQGATGLNGVRNLSTQWMKEKINKIHPGSDLWQGDKPLLDVAVLGGVDQHHGRPALLQDQQQHQEQDPQQQHQEQDPQQQHQDAYADLADVLDFVDAGGGGAAAAPHDAGGGVAAPAAAGGGGAVAAGPAGGAEAAGVDGEFDIWFDQMLHGQ